MTLPDERSWAIIKTHDFLTDLALGEFKRVPAEVRDAAAALLRHYPGRCSMIDPARALAPVEGFPPYERGRSIAFGRYITERRARLKKEKSK